MQVNTAINTELNDLKELLKKTGNKLITFLILLYPLLSSIGRFIPLADTILTLLIIMTLLCEQLPKKRKILKYCLIAFLFWISYSMFPVTTEHSDHVKMLIIFLGAFDAMDSHLYKKAFVVIRRYRKTLLIQLSLILFCNIAFVFLDAGYSEQYTKLWSVSAYRGIYVDPHQCAYHICALLIIMLWISKIQYRRYYFILVAGFEYCAAITGARVPTVTAFAIGAVFAIDFVIRLKRERFDNKGNFMIAVMMSSLILVLVAIILIMNTTFGSKMLESIGKQNFDNGRGSLRTADILLFQKSDWMHKTFGNGTDGVINYHGNMKWGQPIWSHNDFMQVLCGMGIIMFLIYCLEWIKCLVYSFRMSITSGLIVILMIAVAFFNGLYIHSRLTILLPLLFIYMNYRNVDISNELDTSEEEKQVDSICQS